MTLAHVPGISLRKFRKPIRVTSFLNGLVVLADALRRGAVIAANVKPDLDGLLQRTASGDRDAFADLYDAISGAVFGTARSIVRDYSMAEEIAHDVLLEVWTKADRWDRNRGTAATWIMIMTRRRAIDRVRSEQSARDRIETVGASTHQPDTDVVADTVMERSQEREVVQLLDGLTELQREALQLAFYEHKTHAEISKLLGVPLGTIKSRIRDGLVSLERSLGQPI